MKKKTTLWSVSDLQQRFRRINFPEYQREPNVWSRAAKQRLIDSMLRQFDIAPFYFYTSGDDSIDCVDGRQRIGAIMSFLNNNPDDADDNGFEFRVLNELYEDKGYPFAALDNVSFRKLEKRNAMVAKDFVRRLKNYRITVTELSDCDDATEFNLQFARLNLGTVINSGEKLNAMIGALRDVCFGERGRHEFLESTSLPTRRFSKEQLTAQILAQVFSVAAGGEGSYTRTRHFDIQKLFKEHTTLRPEHRRWIQKTMQLMDLLHGAFRRRSPLRNRAIVVSTVLLAYEQPDMNDKVALELAGFVDEFVCRLKWQLGKGLDVDYGYRYLVEFQRHVTQASVEKPAVSARAETLAQEFARWRKSRVLRGDEEYKTQTGKDPRKECRKARR